MIHTNRTVTVGNQESIIDSPIILYRGDREVEVEFTLNGNKFTFANGGNVIKSTNAAHGQLVINTPTGENMFSEVTECHEGKVIFLITKEMIDELVEIGFYSFQIRLFDESQISRVTIPPVFQGIDIRNPIAAEDQTNVVDIGLVDYAIVQKDEYEDLATFLPDGSYNKTDWESRGLITEAKLDKIEDALYTINENMEASDLSIFNRIESINQNVNRQITAFTNEADAEIKAFERSVNTNVEQFKIDTNAAMTAHKNEVNEVVDGFSGEIESINTQLEHMTIDVKNFGAVGDGYTDDTKAFKDSFDYAVPNGRKVQIPYGEYVLRSDEKWSCPKIIGEGSTLNITGSLRFSFNDSIDIRNIIVKTNDGGGYGSSDSPENGYLFQPDGLKSIDYAVIENVKIIGNVVDGKRIAGGIRINECNNFVKISNVYGQNVGRLIALNGNSQNITVRDIVGYNIETLVQAQGGENALYDNLRLINTPDDFDWWIGKDLGVHVNGKDTILLEGGENVILSNIYGEYCIERPIYCQASNVKAHHLQSINTGCFKFVGKQDGSKTIKNILVNDAYLYANVTNTRDSYGQIYGCDDITINDFTIKCENSATYNQFFISGANGEIRINNLKAIGLSNTLFSKSTGVTNKLILNNADLESDESVTLDGILFVKTSSSTSDDIINELIINNLKTNLENYNARTLIYDNDSNLLFNNCIINNSNINGTNNGQYCIYGLNRLNNVNINNLNHITNYAIGGLDGSSLYTNRNIKSNNVVITSIQTNDMKNNIFLKIDINKNNNNDEYILNYIETFEFVKRNTSDYSFELPIKNDCAWKISVQTKNGGVAEYLMSGSVITEIFKSSELFNITTYPATPSANKFNLYINTDTGFLTVRNRIANDSFYVKVVKSANIY